MNADDIAKQFTDELERCYRDDPEIRAMLDDLARQLAFERGRRNTLRESRRALHERSDGRC
jgi:hypothetical protein